MANDDVLAKIVARKRQDVAERMRETPLAELAMHAAPTTRSLRAALAAKGTRFILECKRSSPSKGAIRPGADPRDVARAYLGAADAISVLTDGPFFGGSFDDLRAVRAIADVPLLCKDFVIDPYQVMEARSHGADAVLLMMSVLDDATARACLDEVRRLGMDALVEVHDEAELRRAIALPAAIIGINHRDLRTLSIDLAVSERLAPLVPADRVIVAESGIETRRDVERLAPIADAFLVGSSLMRAPDLRDAARALVFGRVKICGLTSAEDALAAARAGAAIGGLIFAGASPRRVSREVAAEIAAAAPMLMAGVFVNESAAAVAELARDLRLSAVQLHGDEDAAYVGALRALLPEGCAVWKAARVGSDGRVQGDEGALAASDRALFDTASSAARGGTGRAFDWSAIAGHPRLAEGLLAGGIGPDNALAARSVGAFALDVCSRVERAQSVSTGPQTAPHPGAPGRKDPALLDALFTALRGPGRRSPEKNSATAAERNPADDPKTPSAGGPERSD
jgi:indole-3-glycerol phosphate synthase/phosphoribosylanthranilate isomerase